MLKLLVSRIVGAWHARKTRRELTRLPTGRHRLA